MAFCSNCGSQLKEGVKFCGNCGKTVSAAVPAAAPAAAQQPESVSTQPLPAEPVSPPEQPAAVVEPAATEGAPAAQPTDTPQQAAAPVGGIPPDDASKKKKKKAAIAVVSVLALIILIVVLTNYFNYSGGTSGGGSGSAYTQKTPADFGASGYYEKVIEDNYGITVFLYNTYLTHGGDGTLLYRAIESYAASLGYYVTEKSSDTPVSRAEFISDDEDSEETVTLMEAHNADVALDIFLDTDEPKIFITNNDRDTGTYWVEGWSLRK